MLFGMKEGSAGIWRIDGKPRRLTDWPAQEDPGLWTISSDRIIYPDYSDPRHPVFMAQPIGGGAKIPVGYPTSLVAWGDIAVNPTTGQVTYVRWKRNDTDIGWVRVVRR